MLAALTTLLRKLLRRGSLNYNRFQSKYSILPQNTYNIDESRIALGVCDNFQGP